MSSDPGRVASMTGFARAAGRAEPFRFLWELKTVNARGLDLRLRVPVGYDALEPQARALLAQRLTRGACSATLTLEREANPAGIRINVELLSTLVQALEALPASSVVRPASIDGLLGVRGVVEAAPEAPATNDPVHFTADLMAALGIAADALVVMRRNEGARLAGILRDRLASIGRLIGRAGDHPSRKPDAVLAKLNHSLAALLNTGASLDAGRLYQEAVLLAAKADIQEEIDRLRAHVAAADSLLEEGGPVGRRLDFLTQELAREANTLCAKASDVSLTAIGLDLKNEIEQFREQVQNVE